MHPPLRLDSSLNRGPRPLVHSAHRDQQRGGRILTGGGLGPGPKEPAYLTFIFVFGSLFLPPSPTTLQALKVQFTLHFGPTEEDGARCATGIVVAKRPSRDAALVRRVGGRKYTCVAIVDRHPDSLLPSTAYNRTSYGVVTVSWLRSCESDEVARYTARSHHHSSSLPIPALIATTTKVT